MFWISGQVKSGERDRTTENEVDVLDQWSNEQSETFSLYLPTWFTCQNLRVIVQQSRCWNIR